jgi:SagB-type dehydrogenase family enzyme
MSQNAGENFIELTKYQHQGPSQQAQGVPQPPLEIPPDPGQRLIDLPAPAALEIPAIDLRQAIEQRRTLRQYSTQALSQEELSYLLWLTQGVQAFSNRPATQRTVPSAGARHAFETYLLINRVAGLEPGLYRFIATQHKLVEVNLAAGLDAALAEACRRQGHIKASAVTFAWVAVTARMYWRYAERGYRYLHLDAGHVCQNLYLAAEAINCGVCAIAAYDDDKVNALLGVDGSAQFTIYLATVGKKPG